MFGKRNKNQKKNKRKKDCVGNQQYVLVTDARLKQAFSQSEYLKFVKGYTNKKKLLQVLNNP
jgi:hypothetical protein